MRRNPSARHRYVRGLLPLAVVLLPHAAHADPPRAARDVANPGAAAAPPAEPPADPMQRIGSISIGKPNAGALMNAVEMPRGKEWVIGIPSHAFGTDETIEALVHCIRKVAAAIPDTPPVILGSISAERGGQLPPHKSHRTGRDVDVHFYLTKRTPKTWYEPATAENLDRRRTWALIRAFITDSDVELILIDQGVQPLLEEYALSIGEDPTWVHSLFHDDQPYSALIRHAPGHTGHMHVRFVAPYSRRRGVELYDQLVEQGHLQTPVKEVTHEVVKGDTLIAIGKRYGTTVEALERTNALASTVIKVGQKLTITQREDIPGARERVVVPPRRLPPAAPRAAAEAPPTRSAPAKATQAPAPPAKPAPASPPAAKGATAKGAAAEDAAAPPESADERAEAAAEESAVAADERAAAQDEVAEPEPPPED